MRLAATLLVIYFMISQRTRAQFNINQFVNDAVGSWLGKSAKQMRCVEVCKGAGFSLGSRPTLPPFYYKVVYSYKTTVNCSNEIRDLKPLCNSWLRGQELFQLGGMQYFFALDTKLKYFQAQKYCRSRGLELAILRNPSQDSFVLASYLKIYANQTSANNASMQGKLTFWEGKAEIIDRNNFQSCPTFSMNLSDIKSINSTRGPEPCGSANMFICEVPVGCYKDICRSNFISKFRVVPPAPGATTAKPASPTATTAPPFICEQCHLNHTVLYARGCPNLECPVCRPKSDSSPLRGVRDCNGKSYYYEYSKLNHASAMAKCCSYGMRPVSITTDDEAECVKEHVQGILGKDAMDEGRTMWTSATDLGEGCEGRFSWCNGGLNGAVNALTRLTYDQYGQTTPGDCLTMVLKNIGSELTLTLVTRGCDQPYTVVCEMPSPPGQFQPNVLTKRGGSCEGKVEKCPKPERPLERTIYNTENSNFQTGPQSYPMTCDKFYFFGSGAKFDQLSKSCVDKRMEVAYIESFEELNCVRDQYLNEKSAQDVRELEKSMYVALLKGTDKACPSYGERDGPAWCETGATVSMYLMRGGSTGSKCVGIEMKPTKFSITSVPCDSTQSAFLCKGTCSFPMCPMVTCDITGYGERLARKMCGGMYLVVEEKKTMADAAQHCCQLGMALLSLETAAETECVGKVVRDSYSNVGNVWTSGSDLNCKGRFAWCSSGEMFTREPHNKFFIPSTGADDSDPDQNCVSAVFAPGTPLKHEKCGDKFNFICESVGKFGRIRVGPISPSLRTNFNTTVF